MFVLILGAGRPLPEVCDLLDELPERSRKLIELSGFVPGRDIKIEFTGLRPGEKEYEEVMTEDEWRAAMATGDDDE